MPLPEIFLHLALLRQCPHSRAVTKSAPRAAHAHAATHTHAAEAHQDASSHGAMPAPHLYDVQGLAGPPLLVVPHYVLCHRLRIPWLEQLHRRQPRPLHT